MTSKTTVSEYFRQWFGDRVIRPGTLKNRQTMLRNHLEPVPLGSRPLVRVRPSEVQAWVTGRARVLGPGTLRVYVTALRAMFATAVLDGLIARNPVQPLARLSLPKADEPKLVPLTIGQVQAWADAAAPHVQSMILAQAGLGLRISELIALRVGDADFLRREVHVTAQLDPAGRRAPLKTARSRRDVPLPSVTAEVISEHIRLLGPGPGGLIFSSAQRSGFRLDGQRYNGPPSRTDGTWSQHRVQRAYRDAASAAGLPDGTSSHDLRHHYASVLLDAGESVFAVAERIGDSPEMVLKVYGHLMPDREDTTRRAVDAAWKAAEGTQKAHKTPKMR